MKLVFTLILISLFLSSDFSQNKFNKNRLLSGFRGIEWGTAKNKVKSIVNDYYLQEYYGFGVEALCYKGKIAGLDARIDYNFKNNKLVDGVYSLNPNSSFRNDFITLKNYLIEEYGEPDIQVGPSIDSSSVWIKANNYGRFRGPELYWSFKNGFIGLHATKFKDEKTISVLYVFGKTVEEFYKESLVPLK